MKHLSIFLSMILAVAFGAFAQTGVEQGKYFTLTQRSYYLTSNSSAPVVRTGELSNSFFWTTESATQGSADNYYLKLGSYYLSVKPERLANESQYAYKAILTTSKSGAATWNINVEQDEQTISLYDADFGQANIADENKAKNTVLGTSGATVQMTDDINQTWKLTIDQTYYDAAYKAAIDKVNTLTVVSALWSDAKIIADFEKQQTEYQHKYSSMATGNITQAISGMKTVFDGIYNRLYASIPTKVINLGNLGYDGDELTTGSGTLESCWTIAKSGSGYTFQNSFSGLYIKFFPAKDAEYNQGVMISPATEAYFGVSSSATVFDLTPENGAVVLSYQDQTFTLEKPASATSQEMPFVVSTVEAAGLFDAASGYFADAKNDASRFLGNFMELIPGDEQHNSIKEEFNKTGAAVEAFEPKAPAATATTLEVISSIRKQLADINAIVNKAAVPMLLTGEKNDVKHYITAAFVATTNSAVVGSNTYQVPAVAASTLGSTVMSQRLANAMWTFDYVGNGRARFINAEGLYLSEPYTDSASRLDGIIATDSESQAAKLIISNKQLLYSDNTEFAVSGISEFGFESASVMPQSSLVDAEGNPLEQNGYYYIASIGAGGVLGAATPADAVTHNASNLGSYWWLETATTDRNENAYFIHSIYPDYYLSRDLKLVKADINSDRSNLVWYVDENGIAPAAGKFNGYNSGLVISNNPTVNSGRVVTANAFASNGTINPGITLAGFSANNWRNNGWMFVKAGDVDDIINDYIEHDIAWQVEALTVALENISVPFSTNSLSAGIADIREFYDEIIDSGSLSAPERLAKASELSVIMAGVQAKFNEEVFNNALGHNYHIANEGISSSDAYLAGSSSNLRLVNFVDANYNNPDTEWHFVNAGSNASSGFSLLNSNDSALGSVTNSGTVGSSRGYYHLSLNVMWITRDANYNIIATSPWYNVPADLKKLTAPGSDNADDESQAAFDDAIMYGLGLEGVNTPGRGLACTENGSVVSADIYSPMAQWELIHYNPSITGIDGVDTDSTTAEEIMLYNLQGIRVDRATATPGIYISVRSDGSVVKVAIN